MPARHHLSQEQKKQLLKALKENENPLIRERILIILLMNEGKTYQEISKFLEISYPTVADWAVHGDPDNLESLKDRREKGNFRKVTQEYKEKLLEYLKIAKNNPERLQVWFWDGAFKVATQVRHTAPHEGGF